MESCKRATPCTLQCVLVSKRIWTRILCLKHSKASTISATSARWILLMLRMRSWTKLTATFSVTQVVSSLNKKGKGPRVAAKVYSSALKSKPKSSKNLCNWELKWLCRISRIIIPRWSCLPWEVMVTQATLSSHPPLLGARFNPRVRLKGKVNKLLRSKALPHPWQRPNSKDSKKPAYLTWANSSKWMSKWEYSKKSKLNCFREFRKVKSTWKSWEPVNLMRDLSRVFRSLRKSRTETTGLRKVQI